MIKHLKSLVEKRHFTASISRATGTTRPMLTVLAATVAAGCGKDEPAAPHNPLAEPPNSVIDGLQGFGVLLLAFLVAAGVSFVKVEWQGDIRMYLTKVLILTGIFFLGYVVLLGTMDFIV